MFRTLGLHRLAQRDWDALESAAKGQQPDALEQVRILEAYSRGVNAVIRDKFPWTASLSFWSYLGSLWKVIRGIKSLDIEPWHPIDTLVLLRLQSFQWSHGWEKEVNMLALQTLVGETAAQELIELVHHSDQTNVEIPGVIPVLSGNVWAINEAEQKIGTYSAPIVASELPAASAHQNRFYINALTWNDTHRMDGEAWTVRGASEPGIPLVISGSNSLMSWGLAVADVDTEDLFVETFRSTLSNSTSDNSASHVCDDNDAGLCLEHLEVMQHGQWMRPEVFVEDILVTPMSYHEREPYVVKHAVVTTGHGPIVSNLTMSRLAFAMRSNLTDLQLSQQVNISLCSQALRQPSSIGWLLQLARASNTTHLSEAAHQLKTAAMKLVFAINTRDVAVPSTHDDHASKRLIDTKTVLGLVQTGAVVRRAVGLNGTVPTPGHNGDTDWQANSIEDVTPKLELIAPNTVHALFATEKRLLYNSHAMKRLQSLMTNPTAELVQDLWLDTHSSSAVELCRLILLAPSLQIDQINLISDVEVRKRMFQGVTILSHFNGTYDLASLGAPLFEATIEHLSSALLGRAAPLIAPLRGSTVHIAPTYRGSELTALLHGRQWIMRMLAPLQPNSNLGKTSSASFMSKTWHRTPSQLDTAIYDAVLRAMTWLDHDIGSNKNYKNQHWQWGYLHRSTGSHPAAYHSVVKALYSAQHIPQAGTVDTLMYSAADYDAAVVAVGNLMEHHLADNSQLYVRGHVPMIRLIMTGLKGSIVGNNVPKSWQLQGSMLHGQSEHRGSPWGKRSNTLLDFASLQKLNASVFLEKRRAAANVNELLSESTEAGKPAPFQPRAEF